MQCAIQQTNYSWVLHRHVGANSVLMTTMMTSWCRNDQYIYKPFIMWINRSPLDTDLQRAQNGIWCLLCCLIRCCLGHLHDDVTKWKHVPRYWPFAREIHRSAVNSPHKGQWHRALMFSLICVWINEWINNREAGDLSHYRANYDVIVMYTTNSRSFDDKCNCQCDKTITLMVPRPRVILY